MKLNQISLIFLYENILQILFANCLPFSWGLTGLLDYLPCNVSICIVACQQIGPLICVKALMGFHYHATLDPITLAATFPYFHYMMVSEAFFFTLRYIKNLPQNVAGAIAAWATLCHKMLQVQFPPGQQYATKCCRCSYCMGYNMPQNVAGAVTAWATICHKMLQVQLLHGLQYATKCCRCSYCMGYNMP